MLLGPLAPATQGQEPIRGIALFPSQESARVLPKTEVLPHPEAAYTVAAVGATAITFPFKETWCVIGELNGFIIGSVARSMVWAATFGDRLGVGATLEKIGNTAMERTCAYPLYVTAEEIKRTQVPQDAPAAR